MASLKRVVRSCHVKPEAKNDTTTDGVLELSVTVGYLSADVSKAEINKLEKLMIDHCVARVVALERGDLEQHLHFQMVCQACVKSARSFGILVRKYMEWYGVRNMCPAEKVTCKALTNRLLHTWKGMIGYCLKDIGLEHFEVRMFHISDGDVHAGKTLHSIYGKANLKSRVVLTNKNMGERAYIWYKYRENRQLTATMLSTLTDMVNSAMFIPSASWVILVSGLGMEHRRMNSFWKCLVDPTNVDRADVADVFIRKREYVKWRYLDDEVLFADTANDYQYETPLQDGKVLDAHVNSHVHPRPPSTPKCKFVPVVLSSMKKESDKNGNGRTVGVCRPRVLYEESPFPKQARKTVKFSDPLGDFIPFEDIAPLPTNVCLPTDEVLHDSCVTMTPLVESAFWNALSNKTACSVFADTNIKSKDGEKEPNGSMQQGGDSRSTTACEELVPSVVIELSSDSDDQNDTGQIEVIDLSSDSESDVIRSRLSRWPKVAANVLEDRKPAAYFKTDNILSHVKVEPGKELKGCSFSP